MRWYSNAAVRGAIASWMKGRESVWVQFPASEDKPFWVRRARAESASSVKYWVDALNPEYNSIGGFMGTNVIDWDAVDIIPPPLRTTGFSRKHYKRIWNQYLTPAGCEERGLVWEDIWVGKSMLFDFDNPKKPMIAFRKADKVARYLTERLNAETTIVFSGSKGFHVHVSVADSLRLTGVEFKDFKELRDPLKKIGQIYADKVVEIADTAGVNYATEDRSSNFRQGIVRCPYTIHPKTGQIVWPLSKGDIIQLRSKENLTILEIARLLHPWDIPCQSHIPDEDSVTYITPEYKLLPTK